MVDSTTGEPTDGYSGLLQMFAHGQWRYVCDDRFENNDLGSNIACIEMGFVYGTQTDGKIRNLHAEKFWDDVSCQGQEDRLADCSYTSESNCGFREAVSLTCSGKGSVS